MSAYLKTSLVACLVLSAGIAQADCKNIGIYTYCDDGQVYKRTDIEALSAGEVSTADGEKVFQIARAEWEKSAGGEWVIRGTQAWGPSGEICHQNLGVWSCF